MTKGNLEKLRKPTIRESTNLPQKKKGQATAKGKEAKHGADERNANTQVKSLNAAIATDMTTSITFREKVATSHRETQMSPTLLSPQNHLSTSLTSSFTAKTTSAILPPSQNGNPEPKPFSATKKKIGSLSNYPHHSTNRYPKPANLLVGDGTSRCMSDSQMQCEVDTGDPYCERSSISSPNSIGRIESRASQLRQHPMVGNPTPNPSKSKLSSNDNGRSELAHASGEPNPTFLTSSQPQEPPDNTEVCSMVPILFGPNIVNTTTTVIDSCLGGQLGVNDRAHKRIKSIIRRHVERAKDKASKVNANPKQVGGAPKRATHNLLNHQLCTYTQSLELTFYKIPTISDLTYATIYQAIPHEIRLVMQTAEPYISLHPLINYHPNDFLN
ncbi:hypothetical protein RND71_034463 [Anisodus tanguticus]|uniref:Uncharacterized protein n=1 Tax=Anisodus tanguticus TaxID=243964 RepID=A0AAE1RBC5_9SOLA|nr:hypothetical protein RND71_034463 [Anisodus tanguticus]